MKVVILAGGFGSRISEESHLKPKPMIEIGGKPILWHIMNIYSSYGYNEFLICAGYKQEYIKQYFSNYYLTNCDVTFDFTQKNSITIHKDNSENWKVTVVDTGLNTMTGGRIKRIQKYIGDESFMLTYGDAVSDIDISKVVETYNNNPCIVQLSAVKPEGRFGILDIENDTNIIKSFKEKPVDDVGWINAGFMVLSPEVFEFIDGDTITFEKEPLEKIAKIGQLKVYKHNGFWQCMDTLKDKEKLETIIKNGQDSWKIK